MLHLRPLQACIEWPHKDFGADVETKRHVYPGFRQQHQCCLESDYIEH